MDSEGEEIVYDEVDTPSYRTRLKDFVDRYMSERYCQILYEVLSYLYENYAF